ncbi:MAG: type II toxin-antitoxin system HicA family toxin [Nitrososphaerota archaeon]|nr:type II toxin-antitoxin system HicA family toxin [Nitrososphaerota archaeon]MDG7025386.1 type II toxin-antitoxin system HicA family toxin [Nitrososphaerota archaeon]
MSGPQKLPSLSWREVLKILRRSGFVPVRHSSSHILLRNQEGVRIVAPRHDPVGWPCIHSFLFVAYGMFDWGERRMGAFLSFLKEDWLHRMRGSGRSLERRGGEVEGANREGKEEERTYSLKEASAMLGVTVRAIQKWDDQGKIRCVVLPPSARRKVPESEIRRVLGARGPG